MKVACFVNPLVQTSGPGFNYGGVQALVELLQPLHREARCECALITGRWFKDWARQNGKTHLLNGLRTVWLDELSLSNVADATTLEDFFALLGRRKPTNADSFLAWLLERYLVPATLLANGRWFRDYLQRRLNAARSATDPVDAFVPTADADHLMEAWIIKAREPPRMTSLQREDDASTAELFAELRALRREARAAQLDKLAYNGPTSSFKASVGTASSPYALSRRVI